METKGHGFKFSLCLCHCGTSSLLRASVVQLEPEAIIALTVPRKQALLLGLRPGTETFPILGLS